MFAKSRSILLASVLLATPVVAAMAQQNNPAGNMGSNKSVTAAPGTADSKAVSGMNTADKGHGMATGSTSSTTPGGTGHTVVPGSTSTQSGASSATAQQKTGAITGK